MWEDIFFSVWHRFAGYENLNYTKMEKLNKALACVHLFLFVGRQTHSHMQETPKAQASQWHVKHFCTEKKRSQK